MQATFIEDIRAHVVLPTAAILARMGAQIIVTGGRCARTTPLGAGIDEAQAAAELMAVGSLPATHLLQLHHRFPRHLADATRIRLQQHPLDIAAGGGDIGKCY